MSTNGYEIVIPARFAATRLPGKPLRLLAGRPLLQHVCERALETGARVWVATDDQRIAAAASAWGVGVVMTASSHRSGSERIAEVVEINGWPDETVVVNLQGDEPMMPAALVERVAAELQHDPLADMATLAVAIDDWQGFLDPSQVKVVLDGKGYANYFSRAPIPWPRDALAVADRPTSGPLPTGLVALRHIGLYASRAGFLRRYVTLQSTPHEENESLEQLRVLWHGGSIRVAVVDQHPGHGVDTAADLDRLEALLASRRAGQD